MVDIANSLLLSFNFSDSTLTLPLAPRGMLCLAFTGSFKTETQLAG